MILFLLSEMHQIAMLDCITYIRTRIIRRKNCPYMSMDVLYIISCLGDCMHSYIYVL